jgi:hypothetical protein
MTRSKQCSPPGAIGRLWTASMAAALQAIARPPEQVYVAKQQWSLEGR